MSISPSRKLLISCAAILIADIILLRDISFLWAVPLSVFLLLPGKLLLDILVRSPLNRLSAGIYSFGLGLSILIVTGLASNQIGQLFHVSKPLSTGAILAFLHVILALLLMANFFIIRHGGKVRVTQTRLPFPPIRVVDIVLGGLTTLALMCCVGGANLLNNGGSNWLLMVTISICASLPVLLVLLRKRVSPWSYVIVLFGTSVTLLFLSSLRSHYLVGSDILNEFRVFQVAGSQGFWSVSQIASTYNACLSITILPQVLHSITGQDGLFIFRVIFQIIFSVAPVILFCIARTYLPMAPAFLAALCFMVFSNYIGSMPNHIRQEIALLFFLLVTMAMLSRELPRSAKKVFVLIFAFGMVVSHYSTTYIAILLFAIAAITNLVLSFYFRHRHRNKRSEAFWANESSVMNVRMLSIILLFTVFWYSQIIQSSGGPIAYIKTLGTQIVSGENQQADQTSLKDQFNVSQKSQNNQQVFAEYQKQNPLATAGYEPVLLPTPITSPQLRPALLNDAVRSMVQLVKKTYKFIAIASLVYVIWLVWRRRDTVDIIYAELLIGCLAVIAMSFVIPSFTVNYDQERMFQQLLVLIAVPFILLSMSLMAKLRESIRLSFIALFFGVYILVSTSFLSQLTGQTPLPLQLNNEGSDYNRYYVHASEISAIQWMKQAQRFQPYIYADEYATNRIHFAENSLHVNDVLLPGKFQDGSFIYYDSANVRNNVTFVNYKGKLLLFTTPTNYLESTTNKLYNSGGAIVYGKP